MEAALALLLPLVGGMLFAEHCWFTRYRLPRADGHRFYFHVAAYGVVLFLVSLLVVLVARELLTLWSLYRDFETAVASRLTPLFKERTSPKGHIGFVVICLFSMILGWIAPRVINRRSKVRSATALWDAICEDELEELLFEALSVAKPISVTLTSNKVYVGFVLKMPDPDKQRRVLTLLPSMSGYRTGRGKVNFTTFYDDVYRTSGIDADDFRLVVPIDKIMSFSFFDAAAYQRFNQADLVDRSKGRAPLHAEAEEDASQLPGLERPS